MKVTFILERATHVEEDVDMPAVPQPSDRIYGVCNTACMLVMYRGWQVLQDGTVRIEVFCQ